MSKSRIMSNMTVEEVRDGLKVMKTIIVPVGVVEQHGYHLPLSTDIHNAVEMAERISAASGCFVAPSLNYCFSGGTLPGTINLSPHTFSLVLTDIFRSLVVQGFKTIIVLPGHGGTENTRAAYDAAENFQRLDPHLQGITIAFVPFWELSPTFMKCFDEGDFHAGKYETSLMLHLKPELVKMHKARLDDDDVLAIMRTDQDAFLVRHKKVESKYVVPKLTQNPGIQVGVMGDYKGASAELGETITNECVAALASMVKELEAA